MDYSQQLDAVRSTNPALGGQVAGLANLEAILNWVPHAGLSLAGLDLVQQDEFSYDLLLPLSDGRRWLVFGVT